MFKVAELSGNRPLTAIIFSVFQVPSLPLLWLVLFRPWKDPDRNVGGPDLS